LDCELIDWWKESMLTAARGMIMSMSMGMGMGMGGVGERKCHDYT